MNVVGDDIIPTMEEVTISDLPDGGAEVEFSPLAEAMLPMPTGAHDENLVATLPEDFKAELVQRVLNSFEADKNSRRGWEQMLVDGLKLLGIKLEQTTEPFAGACAATHPLIIEAAVKFQSRATLELLPAPGPVKTQIIGAITPEREQQAARKKEFMNWQLTQAMPDYYSESEQIYLHVPIMGSAFSKVYYDTFYGTPTKIALPLDQFYVPSTARTLRRAARYTEVIFRLPDELERDFASGLYERPVNLGEPQTIEVNPLRNAINMLLGVDPSPDIMDAQYEILEQHRYEKLPGEDHLPPAPYVVTVDKGSQALLSVRRNWRENDATREKLVHYVHYSYIPGFGFYGLGLIHLLGNLTKSASAAMRALVDAGQFANLPAGIKDKKLKFVANPGPIPPGTWQDVEINAPGTPIQSLMMQFPYKEPSPVLYQMLEFMIKSGQKFADEADVMMQNAANYGPVGTTLALLEASTRLYSAVHKRLHRAQSEEFKLLDAINAQYLPDEYPYEVVGGNRSVFKTDFANRIEVVPVSDPSAPSTAHRIAKYQLAWELAKQLPAGTVDMELLVRGFLNAADVPMGDRMIIDPERDVEQRDPMTDIKAAMLGKPVRAFPGQNHDAYIAIFGAYMQNPEINGNPANAQALGILNNAVREHQLAKWLMETESVMRATARPGVVPEQLMAEAAQKVLQASQMMATGGPQNPDVMLAQAALKDSDTKAEALEQKQVLGAATLAVRNRDLDLKERKMAIDERQAQAELAARGAESSAKHQVELGKAAAKAGTDIVKESLARLNKDAEERDKGTEK